MRWCPRNEVVLVTALAQDVVVVLVCREVSRVPQEQGGSQRAICGQDRVNWAPTNNFGSQASPRVSPLLRACQHLNVTQMNGWGHRSPRLTSHSYICSQMRSGPGAPPMKLTGPWPQESAHSRRRDKKAVISHLYG